MGIASLFEGGDSEQSGSQGTAGSQTNAGPSTAVNLSAGRSIGKKADLDVTNYIQQTDGGLIEAARDQALITATALAEIGGDYAGVTRDAVEANAAGVARGFDVAESIVRTGSDVARDSIDLSETAIREQSYLAGDVIDFAGDARAEAFDFAGDAIVGNRDFAREVFTDAVGAVGAASSDAVDAAIEANRETSDATAERVLYVAGAVAVAGLIAAAWGARQ